MRFIGYLFWLFFYPMWDNEVQRIGLLKCTPTGYHLRGLAGLLGVISGFSFLVALIVFKVSKRFAFWMLCASLTIGLTGRVVYAIGERIAKNKGFTYDDESVVASWNENGKRITYDHAQWKSDYKA